MNVTKLLKSAIDFLCLYLKFRQQKCHGIIKYAFIDKDRKINTC